MCNYPEKSIKLKCIVPVQEKYSKQQNKNQQGNQPKRDSDIYTQDYSNCQGDGNPKEWYFLYKLLQGFCPKDIPSNEKPGKGLHYFTGIFIR